LRPGTTRTVGKSKREIVTLGEPLQAQSIAITGEVASFQFPAVELGADSFSKGEFCIWVQRKSQYAQRNQQRDPNLPTTLTSSALDGGEPDEGDSQLGDLLKGKACYPLVEVKKASAVAAAGLSPKAEAEAYNGTVYALNGAGDVRLTVAWNDQASGASIEALNGIIVGANPAEMSADSFAAIMRKKGRVTLRVEQIAGVGRLAIKVVPLDKEGKRAPAGAREISLYVRKTKEPEGDDDQN
jgi:hypothetical protein